ncbi:cation:proton antiporter [Micromonospora sp. WMMD975]|uniref:cation:proton antiporter domain-containing protein n=1 Tax=Micromonospora sp. WMMD975 TaxID=3016087 RepID=UPI00249ADA16|nr:cation:proton antiporter [Micromonospora sp. WMMD975]WFE36483.1 cation:proton antiporter [Micromonospora sp. WMMD975]
MSDGAQTVGGGRRGRLVVAAGAAVLAGIGALWGTDLVDVGPVDPLTRFLLAVAVILAGCHLLGELMRRLGQPAVLGEILGGLLLGPSAVGLLSPGLHRWLFPPDVLVNLDRMAQLGLVVFMFLLGCELRTGGARRPRAIGLVVLGGMGLPVVAGFGLALAAEPVLRGAGAPVPAYALFLGLALAVTALPVLARILVDLRLDRSRTGALALSAAAVGDGVAWLALTVILAAATSGADVRSVTGVAVHLALVLVLFLCLRPVLAAIVRRAGSERMLVVVLVVGAIAFAALTQLVGLHPFVGAFLFGVAVPRRSPVVERINHQLQGFTLTILLPLFFAGVGLAASVGLLGGDPGHWLLFLGVLAVATVTKVAGAGGGARLAGLPARDAVRVGVLMNCRGVTELVVASIGLRSGLVNELGFTILVLTAVVTTAMTAPLVRALARDDAASADPAALSDRLHERTSR